ncbi:ester cyclase [Nocardiopsis alborubida]|uniref:Ester cyclase n=1 Tax=Nocardiopsis alborubida TaxID=146802 RepID=A0A7X6MCJ2_9ACTN|nr:ester cyclase [Nocardiopsis alborubida]NKY97200.1 ester cyclase [Nocardiopsis alborubida]
MSSDGTAVVRRLYEAYNSHDVDGVLACWKHGGREYLPLTGELRVPEDLDAHLRGFFAAFPDARVQLESLLAAPDGRVASRILLSGTFTGGRFDGLRANGRPWVARMSEFFTIEDGLIARMDVYMDVMDLARQLGVLPPADGPLEGVMRSAFNLRSAITWRPRP